MVFKIIGLCVAFVAMITGFTAYAISANNIIKEQRKEIAKLRTQNKRLVQQLLINSKPKPLTAEDLKLKVPVFGDAK